MLDARRLKFRHHLLPVTPLQAQAIHTVPGFVTAWLGMAQYGNTGYNSLV